jgi:hypothetical protein
MLKSLQRFLTFLVLLLLVAYLLYQGFLYRQALELLPQGLAVAGLDVSGLSPEEARALMLERYMAPIAIYHREERVELLPEDVGFVLDLDNMLREASEHRNRRQIWQGFLEFIAGVSLEPAQIELVATHDRAALRGRLETIARILDQPAQPPQLLGPAASFELGKPGFQTDLDASLPLAEEALYRLNDREVFLAVNDEQSPELDIAYLADKLEDQISAFDGIGSVFVLDLQTGEEVAINADVAMSGLSIVKIAIILDPYRALDSHPSPDHAKLISETAIVSGDFSANLLLDVVAGQDNAYLGADILTESMQRLGLVNTFIITPYEEPSRPGKVTLLTPANTSDSAWTDPDQAMQTTAEDMGMLLAMIYRCANGGGTLLAVYPDRVTPQECQAILDMLVLNTEGNLIRYGVPETASVSHKHGWAGNTHGDAGIVFSPGGDFVLVEYLSQPATDWLVIDYSFPILREIARTTYNYFNFDNPNLEDPAARAEREALAREAASEQPASDAVEAEPPTEGSG